jgi:hypothetical protein
VSSTRTFALLSLFYMSKFFECALGGSQDSYKRWKQIVYTNMPDIEGDMKKPARMRKIMQGRALSQHRI